MIGLTARHSTGQMTFSSRVHSSHVVALGVTMAVFCGVHLTRLRAFPGHGSALAAYGEIGAVGADERWPNGGARC
jgi:hypothetical protein